MEVVKICICENISKDTEELYCVQKKYYKGRCNRIDDIIRPRVVFLIS